MKIRISNKNKKYCLDVVANQKGNRVPIIVYPCHNGPNQKFTYNRKTRRIKSKSTNKCMELINNRVVQNKCNSKKTQKWIYKKKHWISLSNKKCLDVEGGDFNVGQLINDRVVQNRCNTKKAPTWIYKKRPGISISKKKCLDVEGGDFNSGLLITSPCHKGPNQRFI